MQDGKFDIPVVLFAFKRKKIVEVLRRVAMVKPEKLYIIADQGRTPQERDDVEECRQLIEQEITWDCTVIKNYATENRGVYKNIGEGALWVFQHEEKAIFLEDDNLPEVSFFRFCKEMLEKYQDDTRILWVCGTNYLGDYQSTEGDSYVFTRHMLPCGWASWASKFSRFYDGKLSLCESREVMNRIQYVYCNRKVYRQYRNNWMREYSRIREGKPPISWDYQMDFSIKANNLFGICPCKNQIKNIGVDECSIHGGTSFETIMTQRFCGMDSFPIQFPLKHPDTVLEDYEFEKEIGKIILPPFRQRLKQSVSMFIRQKLNVPSDSSIKRYLIGK